MKKLFTVLASAAMIFSGYAAEKPTNDAFYLVGNMNGWVTPKDESDLASWDYKLTDEDGDGVFTGSFDFTDSPIFKLFSGAGDWFDEVYFGYDSSIILLKDPITVELLHGYGSGNINIYNWVPGTLSLSAEWVQRSDESWVPKITMSGSNQPAEVVKPNNEAFYLVGPMTNWTLPTTETASSWKYKLTDEDRDGVYTGSFELTKDENQFGIFSEPNADWGNNSCFGYSGYIYVFNDEDFSINLSQNSAAATLGNWEGGIINLSIEWVENSIPGYWMPRLTVNGPDQPKKPEVPDVYLIGDFNDWRYPTNNSLNGAIPLSESHIYENGIGIHDLIDWDAASLIRFSFCKKDKTSDDCLVLNGINNVPFTLYSFKSASGEGRTIPNYSSDGEWVASETPQDYSFTLKDWQGGKIYFYYGLLFSGNEYVVISGDDTKVLPDPEPLYIIAEYNGTKEKFPAEWFNAENYYSFNVWAKGENVSIIISTEDSFNPDPANCYGIEGTLAEAGLDYQHRKARLSLVKGGQPFTMDFYPYSGRLFTYINYPTSIVSVELDYKGGPIAADHIYVCGNVYTAPDGEKNDFLSPSAGNQEEYDKYWSLKEEESGIFTGMYYIPARVENPTSADDLPQFRFFTELLGWSNEASLGSAEDDFYCLPADLDAGPKTFSIVHNGLGNWGVNLPTTGQPFNWESNWVKMTVNCNTGQVTIELAPSGVEEILSDTDTVESWYNLQGIKVDKPEKGLYIHIINGKSRVENVR